jgi:GNAT superfamily N-acetyltransferase
VRADLTLRAATPVDVPAIFEIRTAVRENAITIEKLAAVGITPGTVVATLGSVRRGWVVVNAENQVVAFAMVNVEENKIMALFTRPGWEGRGCGTTLLAAAANFLFESGTKKVWLTTGGSTPAAGFYLRRGWVPVTVSDEGEAHFELDRAKWPAAREHAVRGESVDVLPMPPTQSLPQ